MKKPAFTIEKVAGTDEMREIHKLAFGGDPWPGDDHEFWVAKDEHGAIAGFCSAVLLATDCVFLSRAAVTIKHSRRGLHKKLIKVRLQWAKSEGATLVVTHVSQYNYASMTNLLKAGFTFAGREHVPRGYKDFHFMWRETGVWSGSLKAAITAMLEA